MPDVYSLMINKHERFEGYTHIVDQVPWNDILRMPVKLDDGISDAF